jgi:hypothetical protein
MYMKWMCYLKYRFMIDLEFCVLYHIASVHNIVTQLLSVTSLSLAVRHGFKLQTDSERYGGPG